MKKYHYVYRIDCLVDGCYYIGVHSTNNMNDGYFGSGSGLRASIRKHGKQAFRKTILSHHETREEAINEEVRLLNSGVTDDPLSYNIAYNGVKLNHLKKSKITELFVDHYKVRIKKKGVTEEEAWWKTVRYTFQWDEQRLSNYLARITKPIKPNCNNHYDDFCASMLTLDNFKKLAKSLTFMYNEAKNYRKVREYTDTIKDYRLFDYLIVKELSISEYNAKISENKSISHA